MSWDTKAERIAAKAAADRSAAEADKTAAETEAIRVQTDLARDLAQDERDAKREDRKRVRAAERRKAAGDWTRRHGGLGLPVVAVGAPALIAWRGQLEFAVEKMKLGVMAPLLPIAVEGSVLYSAFLTHQAVAEGLPSGRYRALTWTLASVAAAMNFWHGKSAEGMQVGVMLGLTSLLSILLLELTVALHKAKANKKRQGSGWDAAAVRRALIRRVRYPRLSLAASSLAAARRIDAEAAWAAAWVDRYGIGPDSTRRDRKTAKRVLKREQKGAAGAARSGALTIVDGQIVPAAWFGAPDDERDEQADSPPVSGERLVPQEDVAATAAALESPEVIARFERLLTEYADQPGGLRELPPARDTSEYERAERSGERPDERSGERSNERPGERSRKRPGKRLRRSRKARSASGRKGTSERLEQVRSLLDERPGLSGAQIEAETGIPESTARRLAARVRREQSTNERPGGEQSDGSEQS